MPLSRPDWQIFQELSEVSGRDLGFASLEHLQRERARLSAPTATSTCRRRCRGRAATDGDAASDAGGRDACCCSPIRCSSTRARSPARRRAEGGARRAGVRRGASGRRRAARPVRRRHRDRRHRGRRQRPAGPGERGHREGDAFVPFNNPGLPANTLLSGGRLTATARRGDRRADGAAEGAPDADWLDWILLVARVVVVFVGLLLERHGRHLDGAQGPGRHAEPHRAEPRRAVRPADHDRGRHQAVLQGGRPPDEHRPARLRAGAGRWR